MTGRIRVDPDVPPSRAGTRAVRPVVWSVAGLDSGGGAGLAADLRAADAAGVHLCPVAAALTAQSTVAVEAVFAVPSAQLAAQLDAMAEDLPPAVVKTGLLASVENVRLLAGRLDAWRRRGPVALVVDPVLRASTGASFADDDLVAAYREHLLPRATLVTPNRAEAARLAGPDGARETVPRLARRLRDLGAAAACVTGGDESGPLAADWLDGGTRGPRGWVCAPRVATRHTHGSGCTFATAAAAAIARGFPVADAVVLAKMLVRSGLRTGPGQGVGHVDAGMASPGAGAGPVRPSADFIVDPACLPWVADGEGEGDGADGCVDASTGSPARRGRSGAPRPAPAVSGLYAIAADGTRAAALLDAGVRTVQLRLKRRPGETTEAWRAHLLGEISRAAGAACRSGGTLVVNDHWEAAVESGVDFVHLGQEDLLALDAGARARLSAARAGGLRLGISSHSPWELARARAWTPDYVACGPVWPTTTKDMPWRPQGLDNLRWWVSVAGAPVVAIGGLTAPERLAAVAAAGASAGAVARALATADAGEAARWCAAWSSPVGAETAAAAWPHPSLAPGSAGNPV